jgi:hypothetical protein
VTLNPAVDHLVELAAFGLLFDLFYGFCLQRIHNFNILLALARITADLFSQVSIFFDCFNLSL